MTTVSASARWGSVGLGLGGGAVAAASLPPFDVWPLAFLGVALFLFACEDRPVGTRALTGFAFGLGLFVPGLWWAQHFNWYGAALLMLIEAAFMAAAGAAMTPGRGRTLSAIGAITLLEAARVSWPLGGLPIGGMALGQTNGPLLALARLAGPMGIVLGVVVIAAGVRVALTALAMRNTQAVEAGRRGLHAAALVGVVALAIGYGAIAPSGGPALALRTVAAVQGGGPRGTSAEQVDPTSVTRAHLSALATVPKGTQLTLLPEDVVGLTRPLKGSWQNEALSSAARRLSTTLLAGVTTPGSPTTFHNFVVAYGPHGHVLGTVEKVHRVPFGEYVPARSLLSHVADLSGVPKDAIVGTKPEILNTPAGRLGVLISFEVFFSDRSGDAVAHGATLLVVPTNTTSYPTSQMPAQELAAARLQAVERGRDLVQASPTGYSAIINNKGTVVARSSLSARDVLLGTVALRGGATPFSSIGSWPTLAIAAACLLAGQLRAHRSTLRRRAKARGDEHEAGDAAPDTEPTLQAT
jgi:apolipoprotein N-acyltransferase